MILPGILSLVLSFFWPQDPAGGWCTVSAASPDVPAAAVASIEREVAPALSRLRQVFPDQPKHPFRILVHASAARLPAVLRPLHHDGSPGFALLGRHEIHLLLEEANGAPAGVRAVIVHEMAHEFLDQACAPWGGRIPRWFHEGLAQVIAGDTYLGASEEAIVWRAATQQLLAFSELEDGFPREPLLLRVAYAQSYSYVAWLERRIGLPALVKMARSVGKEQSLDLALVLATDASTAQLLDAWRDHVLHGSGASWRVLLQQFFALSMVLALPLLALAMIRRQRADHLVRERMEREEGAQPELPESQPYYGDDDDEDLADGEPDAEELPREDGVQGRDEGHDPGRVAGG